MTPPLYCLPPTCSAPSCLCLLPLGQGQDTSTYALRQVAGCILWSFAACPLPLTGGRGCPCLDFTADPMPGEEPGPYPMVSLSLHQLTVYPLFAEDSSLLPQL